MKTLRILLLSALILCIQNLFSQPAVEWQKCIGGTGADFGKSICWSYDSTYYYAAGYTSSNNGNISGNHGAMDIFVSKLDSSGNIKWTKTYGGLSNDMNYCIIPTADNGILIGGCTNSNDTIISGNHGGFDVLLIKTDSSGNIQWKKVYGGSGNDGDCGLSVINVQGGYLFITGTESTDGDVTGSHGGKDFWLVKVDPAGNIILQKCYGGSQDEDSHIIIPSVNGGYIFAGHTSSNDGDVSGLHGSGNDDAWVVKIDSSKNILWQKCLGGTETDLIKSMCFSDKGNIILSGYTNSNDGDITANKGGFDSWLLKLDSAGNKIWSKVYGGTGGDYITAIFRDYDNKYIAGGYSNSVNGDVTGNQGDFDFWVFKVDSTGTLMWQKSYGGTGNDREETAIKAYHKGIITTGFLNSNNGDISGNHGFMDCWVAKLNFCQKPSAFFSVSSDTVCAGDTVFTINSSTGATTYKWYLNNSIISTSVNALLIPLISGTDTISLISNFGECSDTAKQIFFVKPLPVVNLGNDTSICTGSSITFNAGNTGSNYLWSTGATTQTISVTQADTINITVNLNNCISYDTIAIGIKSKPDANFSYSGNPLCTGDTLFLTNSSIGATSIQWLLNDSLIANTINTFIVFSSPAQDTISLIASNGDCFDTAKQIVVTNPLPSVNLGNDTTLTQGYTLILDAGNSGANYLWSTGEITQTITISQPGTYSVTVTLNECSESDTITVNMHTGISVYNLNSDITVYPIPMNDELNILLKSNTFKYIVLCNIEGRILKHFETEKKSETINTSNLNKGVYLLRLIGNSDVRTYRIVKM